MRGPLVCRGGAGDTEERRTVGVQGMREGAGDLGCEGEGANVEDDPDLVQVRVLSL